MIENPEKPQRPLFRKAANSLTEIRKYGGYAVAGEIAWRGRSFRSWRVAAEVGALMATDLVDGWLARKSNIPSVVYTQRDERVDKELYRNVMTAVGVVDGDPRYLAYTGITDMRNGLTDRWRDNLRAHNLEAGARRIGKYKTLLQNVGILLDVSPIGENHPEFVHNVHQMAVGLSVVSGIDIGIDALEQVATQEASTESSNLRLINTSAA